MVEKLPKLSYAVKRQITLHPIWEEGGERERDSENPACAEQTKQTLLFSTDTGPSQAEPDR